ncbi:isochorismatase family protein [Algoriphagus sp. C2-6-M1]|uniref:cysteine hydrolase family protein n=1 Tax=Algoriphagus persicinus TaxID=3108754 RepID=UPI002B366099|nr:isochorismatase family protein [Algoriphagus sp. C2-6-M1]MEB2781484.1 isochorismatase family protein [Algoriphagus sp. C2-6-M1]
MKNRRALIIIDMQKGCFTSETPKFDSENVIARINALSKIFREDQSYVIFIQQDSSKWGRFIPNTADWEILSDLMVNETDISINKTVNDAFYQSNLDSVLKELNIKELFITGFATDFCVEATVQSALTKDYNITVVSDGHTTGERPHLKAKKIIEHNNWIWQNMIPTKGKIEVKTFEQIKTTLQHTI